MARTESAPAATAPAYGRLNCDRSNEHLRHYAILYIVPMYRLDTSSALDGNGDTREAATCPARSCMTPSGPLIA